MLRIEHEQKKCVVKQSEEARNLRAAEEVDGGSERK